MSDTDPALHNLWSPGKSCSICKTRQPSALFLKEGQSQHPQPQTANTVQDDAKPVRPDVFQKTEFLAIERWLGVARVDNVTRYGRPVTRHVIISTVAPSNIHIRGNM